MHQSCFTHVASEERWGTASSSILQNQYVREIFSLKNK